MAVLVSMAAPGMDVATYDQVSTKLVDMVKRQPGFMMHVSYPINGGFAVGEVWNSEGEFNTWFTENVQPNVPAIQHEVTELHSVVQP
jgi:hypothetical protein